VEVNDNHCGVLSTTDFKTNCYKGQHRIMEENLLLILEQDHQRQHYIHIADMKENDHSNLLEKMIIIIMNNKIITLFSILFLLRIIIMNWIKKRKDIIIIECAHTGKNTTKKKDHDYNGIKYDPCFSFSMVCAFASNQNDSLLVVVFLRENMCIRDVVIEKLIFYLFYFDLKKIIYIYTLGI